MVLWSASSRAAAALVAAAVLMASAACSGDGGDSQAPTSKPPGSPAGDQSTTTASPRKAPKVIDLASDPALLTVETGPQDLSTGSTGVAVGDFNDDGEADALIGAPQADGPNGSRADAGQAYVLLGPLSGDLDPMQANVTIYGALPGDSLGFSVLAGDLNSDGTDDIIVAAPGVTAGFDPRSDQGRVYVFYGGKKLADRKEFDLASDVFDFAVTGAEGFSRLGDALAMGDVNGDGRGDLITGAPFAGRVPGSPPGGERTTLGEVYVVFGGTDRTGELNIAAEQPDVTLVGAEAYGQFGSAISAADVNGDGLDDIIVGAHRSGAAAGLPQSGAVHIFLGRKDISGKIGVPGGGQDASLLGPAANASFGFPLPTRDFNGEDIADIAAGARVEGTGDKLTAGSVRIIFGSDGIAGEIDLAGGRAGLSIPGRNAGELLPSSLATTDADGDGIDDLVIGSMLSSPDGRPGAGSVFIVRGGADLPQTIDLENDAGLVVIGSVTDARLGNAIAAGPLSADAPGLLIVAPGPDAGGNGGAVFGVVLEGQ